MARAMNLNKTTFLKHLIINAFIHSVWGNISESLKHTQLKWIRLKLRKKWELILVKSCRQFKRYC